MNLDSSYKRIMIFGMPGSGKSTFALALHQAIGIPLHHLDKHFYQANWVERNYQEFMQIQHSIVEQNEWIIDGNNTKSLELRYSHANLVLYFNYPRWFCYLRTFKRLFSKKTEFDDRAVGCKETIRFSLLRYMWSYEGRVINQIYDLKERFQQVEFVEITHDRQTQSILNRITLNNNLTITTVELGNVDLPKVIALCIGNPTNEKIQSSLNYYSSSPNHLIIGATYNRALIGLIGVSIENNIVIVNHLAILDEYRRYGIAKRLVHCVAKCFQMKSIIAETDDEAIGFYRALNFHCDVFTGPYGIRYKCKLNAQVK